MKKLVSNESNKITSLEIAEISGKKHHHLMRDIKKMEQDWIDVNQSKFGLVEYKDLKGEARPMYLLNKEECLYITSKFNNKIRAKLILRWKELEEKQNKHNLPITHIEALESYLLELKRNEKLVLENKKKDKVIQIQAPKVEYHDEVLDSSTAHPITYIAKELGMSAVNLNKRLHELKIQYKKSGSWFLYSKYQNKDFTKTSTYTRLNPEGETITSLSTKWTEKGRKFIHQLYSDGKLK